MAFFHVCVITKTFHQFRCVPPLYTCILHATEEYSLAEPDSHTMMRVRVV